MNLHAVTHCKHDKGNTLSFGVPLMSKMRPSEHCTVSWRPQTSACKRTRSFTITFAPPRQIPNPEIAFGSVKDLASLNSNRSRSKNVQWACHTRFQYCNIFHAKPYGQLLRSISNNFSGMAAGAMTKNQGAGKTWLTTAESVSLYTAQKK